VLIYKLIFFVIVPLTDSGVGAGIDSYYEYLMKAYILLGDDQYLHRFNTVSIILFIIPDLYFQKIFKTIS